jgi:topoisomerase-4 subunit A
LDSTGKAYSTSAHDLPSARTQGEPLTARLNPAAGALFTHLLAGNPDDWIVLATHLGQGFRVQLKELLTKNKAGKAVITLSDNAMLLKPAQIANEDDLLAVATQQGRMLIFPVADLPAMARGKGNKLIQLTTTDLKSGKDRLVAVVVMPKDVSLKVVSGKQFLTLKSADIAQYSGKRSNRGFPLPRGFQRVDGLLVE